MRRFQQSYLLAVHFLAFTSCFAIFFVGFGLEFPFLLRPSRTSLITAITFLVVYTLMTLVYGGMDIGKKKVAAEKLGNTISFVKGDCLALPFADESFDAVTSAFGIRNFENLDKGLKEMYRVLKKGGALCIIELTTPVCFLMKQLFKIYSHTILPMYGRIISKDKDAYRYLTASIEAFPQGETMVGIIKSAGFNAASFKRMTFGICTIYIATK